MNAPACRTAFPHARIIEYWLGEIDDPVQAQFEEHMFGCSYCSERVNRLARLGAAIRGATLKGHLHAVFTPSFVKRLQGDGLCIREYRMHPGGSVMCTVAPHDDLVLAHLHAPLRDVSRLDVLVHEQPGDTQVRVEDVAFDPNESEIVMLPNVVHLRALSQGTLHVQLLSVSSDGEQIIGNYTFNHSKYTEGA